MIESFGIKDILDIVLVALMLYYLYRIMRESGTTNIFYGVLAFIVLWVVASEILEMRLIGSILDKFMSIGLLILVILFQDQIKRFLVELGSKKRWKFLTSIFHHRKDEDNTADLHTRVMPIVYACMAMAKSKLHDGALIISSNRLKAAGCILPVSHDTNVPRSLGLRHRSALGISQATDAFAIVVSEETGNISAAYRGKLSLRLSSTEIEKRLSSLPVPV